MNFLIKCFAVLSLAVSCTQAQNQPPVQNADFLPVIKNFREFEMLQAMPLSEKYSNVKSVKVLYDLQYDKLYFIQSRMYKFHFSFAQSYLESYDELSKFNNTEYAIKSDRKYILSSLNYFTSSGLFVLDFFADDQFKEQWYDKFIAKMQQAVYFSKQLKVLPNEWMRSWAAKSNFINEDEIYGKQNYQALVQGTTYGYLRIMQGKNISKENLQENDIVITDKIPLDLPPVQGVITQNFQTPLSHINILTHARGTPNAALKTIFISTDIKKYEGKLVRMLVSADTVKITEPEPSFDFATWVQLKNRKKKPVSLSVDNSITKLLTVQELSLKNIASAGGKAAHFGELAKVKVNGRSIPLPENIFAIPVFFYTQHLQANNIFPLINDLLTKAEYKTDIEKQKEQLKKIRKAITDAPIDKNLLDAVLKKMKNAPYVDYRFRSSTNAEDVEGFSGAGLYESKTGSLTDTAKQVDKAIKKVWASAWNYQAYAERAKALINQQSVAMAILVHRSFGTEEVNGVAITADLYRYGYPSFTINIQKGEVSVANAEDSVASEQFMVKFSSTIKSESTIAVDPVTYSPLNNFKPLMSRKEIVELTEYLKAVKKHFYNLYKKKAPADYDAFSVDIEFKLNKGDRKIYIKQARLY